MTEKNNYFFFWETKEGEKMKSPFFTNRSDTNFEKQLVEEVFKGKVISKTLVNTDEELFETDK
jgi:hypothetical protein